MERCTVGNEDGTPDELSTVQQGVAPIVLAAPSDEEALSGQALDRDTTGPGASADLALHEPTAREVARSYLHETVRVGTRNDPARDRPRIQGTTAAGPTEPSEREWTTGRHDDTITIIRDRMQRALDDGDLPPDADPDLLARHLMTMSNGITVQAGDGVRADQLHAIADLALQTWPAA